MEAAAMYGKRFRRKAPRRGYVLLMTLLILCLAIVLLLGVTRNSLDQALLANRRTRELQERWGLQSLRMQLPAVANGVYTSTADRPPGRTALPITLSNIRYEITVAHEGSKVNLNHLAKWYGQQQVIAAIEKLSRQHDVLLRPNDFSSNRRIREPYERFSQVFDLSALSSEIDLAVWLQQAAQKLTLWGDGRLDWRLADQDALRFVLQLSLPGAEVQQLLEAREEGSTLETALLELEVTRAESVRRNVSDETYACYRFDILSFSDARRLGAYTMVVDAHARQTWIRR